ncbi:MAG: helix-turn-helix domain-containing protein [Candidatus Woesearchaeota archaeon]
MDSILDRMGFSEYKKKAYLALVKLEKGTAIEISRKSNMPTSKIYETLKWLYENGFISVVSEKPLTYRANDPKAVLKSEVNSRISELTAIRKDIDKISTSLPVAEKASFQVAYGRDAFYKKVKEAVSRSNESIVAIVKHWRLDYELRVLNIEFTKKGGSLRLLGPVTKENKSLVEEWKKSGAKTKHYIPDSTRFTVWDEKIIAIGFKEKEKNDYFSLWIENEYLGKILTRYFNSIWKSAKTE